MTEPTLALRVRLEKIINRNPIPTETPDDHTGHFFLDQATTICDRQFPARYTHAQPDHPEVTAWITHYRHTPHQPRSLLLLGPTGVGKTHQAYAALRAAVYQPTPIRWAAITAADLYATLRPRPDVDLETQLHRYRTVHLLLIDDLGAAKPTEWTEEITYRILNTRYNQCLPVIITTNLALEDFKHRLGDRITSRLAEMCTRVILTGTDRRRQKPEQP